MSQCTRPFCKEGTSVQPSQWSVCGGKHKTGGSYYLQPDEELAWSFHCWLLGVLFFMHSLAFCLYKSSCRSPSSVKCTVQWTNVFIDRLYSMFCAFSTRNGSVMHVRSFVQEFQGLVTMSSNFFTIITLCRQLLLRRTSLLSWVA